MKRKAVYTIFVFLIASVMFLSTFLFPCSVSNGFADKTERYQSVASDIQNGGFASGFAHSNAGEETLYNGKSIDAIDGRGIAKIPLNTNLICLAVLFAGAIKIFAYGKEKHVKRRYKLLI